MLQSYLPAWAFLALADLPHRLAAFAAGRGPTPNLYPQPSPTGPGSGGVVGRWLSDPAGRERRLLTGLRATLTGWWASWHLVVVAVAVVLVVFRVGLAWWRVRTWRRARDGGRWLHVVPPPATTTDQGRLLWAGLAGLIRPGRLGRHLRLIAWEVHADEHRLVAGLWLPSSVDAGQVGRAVRSSYPRARVVAGERGRGGGPDGLAAPDPESARPWLRPPSGRRRGAVWAGYLLVPASMWAPLLGADPRSAGRSGEVTADGLRMAYTTLASTPAGYRAVLQILTRPLPAVTRRAARRVRRAGGGPPGPGLAARGVLAVLDLAQVAIRAGLDLAGPTIPARSTATRRARTGRGVAVDAVTAQRHRDALVKASGELVEVCVRVAVSGPNRRTCREKAFEIANAMQVAIAHPLHAIRLPHTQATVTARVRGNWRAVGPLAARAGHRRGWFTVTDAELGGLARLPHQPASYRFEAATAPHLPAPPGIPLLPFPDTDDEDRDGANHNDGQRARPTGEAA